MVRSKRWLTYILFLITLSFVVGCGNTSENVSTINDSQAVEIISFWSWENFMYHFRWGIHWIICIASLICFIFLVLQFPNETILLGIPILILVTFVSFFIITPGSLSLEEITINKQIKTSEKAIKQLKKIRDQEFNPQLKNNNNEVDEIRIQIKQISPSVVYKDYESFLRSKENYLEFQYETSQKNQKLVKIKNEIKNKFAELEKL